MQTPSELETLYRFISGLRQRHLELHHDSESAIPHGQSLAYADALLRHRYMAQQMENLPPQIVIIGPTQAGKSTLINALLGVEAAEASPLAGFTRHAQGFTPSDPKDGLMASIQSLLPDWNPIPIKQLSADDLSSFSLTQLSAVQQFGNDPFLLWDTPDFDSVNSRDYRATVPTLCAMADVIVLIVSKEKYADQTVWDTLQLIAPIQKPLLIVLNKTSLQNAKALEQAMQQKLQDADIDYQEIFTLSYQQDITSQPLLNQLEPVVHLRRAIKQTVEQEPQQTTPEKLKPWLESYWDDWVAPIRAENNASQAWLDLISTEQQAALDIYQRDYLQQPHYAETMNKAIIRLLELLEIPMLASGLSAVRQVITWPARKLGTLIKDQTKFGSADQKTDQETSILQEAGHHFLLSLEQEIAAEQQDSTRQHWWKNLSVEFSDNKTGIEKKLEQAINLHQQAFQPEIEAAANNLYAYLEQHPLTLNGLRTARVGADAAAVVLAIKTGGLSLHDLALAPAFVAVTSFLAEGAVGQHMHSVEAELKNRQLESVKQAVFIQSLAPALTQLPQQMSTDSVYGIRTSELNQAESALASFNE